jgi:biotin synthase
VKPTDDVVDRIARNRVVQRTCISMVTHKRSVGDSLDLTRRLRAKTDKPVSILISPTLVEKADLEALKEAGADRIGIAFDLATAPLFEKYRGRAARGPHRWERYWDVFEKGVEVFGPRMVGSHFIVGLGETEREMVEAFQRVYDRGGVNHLFSFFPEGGGPLATHPQPPMDVYRRVQLACELIDADLARADRMRFDADGRIVYFGVNERTLQTVIESGTPFRTRGCQGADGKVACNRPYANSLPGDDTIRNFPFAPDAEDLQRIRAQLGGVE